MQNLRISSSQQGSQRLLRVEGYIDLSNQQCFTHALDLAASDESVMRLALDLRAVDFIGSRGVSSILKTHSTLRSRERSLQVVAYSRQAARIFSLLRVEYLLA